MGSVMVGKKLINLKFKNIRIKKDTYKIDLLSMDDTDSIESRGTGSLARTIAKQLAKKCFITGFKSVEN
jgi:hypothetical protein